MLLAETSICQVKKFITISLCLAWLATSASAANFAIQADTGRTPVNDSLKVKKDTSHGRDLSHYAFHKPGTYIVPVVLVAYGGLSLFVKPVRHVDYYFKGLASRVDPTPYEKVSDFTQLAPGVLVYALNLAGDEGQDRFWDRTALLALSGAILTITDGTKYLAHRDRPYGTDPLSFPSGHTGAAFVAAEFLSQEYSWKSPWYGVIGYTFAGATGILRVYGHAHWFSDCVEGAGLGMLSTKAAYALYPHVRKLFMHKGKNGKSAMLIPTAIDGAPGLVFAMQL